MGREVDLTGLIFGKLCVHSLVGLVTHGRNKIKVWLCVCDCGRKIKCRQDDLRKGIIPACRVCRRGPCVICGSAITNELYGVKRNTCSDLCQELQTKAKHKKSYRTLMEREPNYNRERYFNRILKDPDFNKKRYARKLMQRAKLPESERDRLNKAEYQQSNDWRKRWTKAVKNNAPQRYESFRAKNNARYKRWYMKRLAQSTAGQP